MKDLKINIECSENLNSDYSIPIYTPRTSFHLILQNDLDLLNDLTLNFDPFTIQILKNEFEKKNGSITKMEFIQILKMQLFNWRPNLKNREQKLIRCLNILFDEIDINGNKILEWEEFTNYIIDKANVMSTMKLKNDVFEKYKKSSVQFESTKFGEIAKCIYIKKLGIIAFFEHNRDIIHFADVKTGKILPNILTIQISNSNQRSKNSKKTPIFSKIAKRAMLLDIISIEYNSNTFLIASSNDGGIRFFIYKKTFEIYNDGSIFDKEIIYSKAQRIIAWDPINEILFSGERNGTINIYDKRNEPQLKKLGISSKSSQYEKKIPKAHSECITVLLPIIKLQFLASAGMDRKIILWDIIKNTKRREYKNYHKKAITTLDYNENLVVLVSGGIDHTIFVWNPYINTPIYCLKNHKSPISKLSFVKDPLHLVSLDTSGVVKIWDVHKLVDMYSFSVKSPKNQLDNFVVISSPLSVVFFGKEFCVFDYRVKNRKMNFEENMGQDCRFVGNYLIFVTPIQNKVKIWNALTGDVKKIYSNLTSSEITAFQIDELGKRFFIGDSNGKASVYNIFNGSLLKNLNGHKSEIKFVEHSAKNEFIITIDITNLVLIHDDRILHKTKIIRSINLDGFVLINQKLEKFFNSLICINQNYQVLSVNLLSGKKSFFSTDSDLRQDSFKICLLDKLYSNFILSHNNNISLFCFSPLVLKSDIIFNWKFSDFFLNKNEYEFLKSKSNLCLIKYYQYTEDKYFLIIGDDQGFIHNFEISELILEIKIIKNIIKKKWIKDPSINFEMIKYQWSKRVHDTQINTIEIYPEENLFITTCIEKKVIISNLKNGDFIEILRNDEKENKLKPIAYKNILSSAIFTKDLKRIDYKFIKFKNEIEKLEKINKKNREEGIYGNMEDIIEMSKKKFEKQDNNVDDFFNEFDPYFFLNKKIDRNLIDVFSSNANWNLFLDIDKHCEKFKNIVDKNLMTNKMKTKKKKAKQENIFKIIQNEFEKKKNLKKNHYLIKALVKKGEENNFEKLPKIRIKKKIKNKKKKRVIKNKTIIPFIKKENMVSFANKKTQAVYDRFLKVINNPRLIN